MSVNGDGQFRPFNEEVVDWKRMRTFSLILRVHMFKTDEKDVGARGRPKREGGTETTPSRRQFP